MGKALHDMKNVIQLLKVLKRRKKPMWWEQSFPECTEFTNNYKTPCQNFDCKFNLFFKKLNIKKPNFEMGAKYLNCDKIFYRLNDDITQEMLGQLWGVTRAAIQCTEKNALNKLRKALEGKPIKKRRNKNE